MKVLGMQRKSHSITANALSSDAVDLYGAINKKRFNPLHFIKPIDI